MSTLAVEPLAALLGPIRWEKASGMVYAHLCLLDLHTYQLSSKLIHEMLRLYLLHPCLVKYISLDLASIPYVC